MRANSDNARTLAVRNNGNATRARARAKRLARWQARFLKALRRNPNVTGACRAAGAVNRTTAYRRRLDDAVFAAKWDEALDASVDEVEEKAFRIAKDGDNQMIQFVLKAHRPSIYRDTSRVELDARVGGIVFLPEKKAGNE